MSNTFNSESINRLVKQAVDSGRAQSFEEAEAMFRGYRLTIQVDADAAGLEYQQIVLLTTTALATRVFLGGVTVSGIEGVPNLTAMPFGSTLEAAVEALGGTLRSTPGARDPMVVIGDRKDRQDSFAVRPVAAGWRGGILPAHSPLAIAGNRPMPLAGMLAAALAVNEAFLHVSSGTPAAGRRPQGLSLWNPASRCDWWAQDLEEPLLTYLPSKLWLLGLGHLGQAYLWGLGLLPYAQPADLSLVLQDFDVITAASQSTSILSDGALIGMKKTRAMAHWAELRGFQTTIVERPFDNGFKRQPSEPSVALCGLDNAIGRQALDQVGFDLVVEAGLGRGHRDFRSIRLHVLPGSRPSAKIWQGQPTLESPEELPAYTKAVQAGVLDRCGMALLAGKAVGAPFVGATAATLALAEIIRALHGGPVHQLIDLDLLSLEKRELVPHCTDFSTINPGFARPSSCGQLE